MIDYFKKTAFTFICSIALLTTMFSSANIMISATELDSGKEKEDVNTKLEKECIYRIQAATNDPFIQYQWFLINNGNLKYKELLSTGNVGRDVIAKKGIDIQWEKARAYFKTKGANREIIVALIDTGVDTKQTDLKAHLWTNELERFDGRDDDNNGFVDDVYGWNFFSRNNKLCEYSNFDTTYQTYEDDHGTHCAGIIAATANNKVGVAGIAGDANVKIMILKALGGDEGETGSGVTSAIVDAIQYAEKMGAQICNISFGGYEEDPVLKRTIEESSMLFVCAAGNEARNIDTTPIYPAGYNLPNVISVCNINADGTLAKTSNFGAKNVDLAAPGSDIVSTLVNNEFGKMTGTSMAAPMVTGSAAMLYSFHTNMTASDAKKIILSSVKKLPALKGKVKSGGMVNLEAMLKKKYSPPPTTKEITLNVIVEDFPGEPQKKINIAMQSQHELVEQRLIKGNVTAKKARGNKKSVTLSKEEEQVYIAKTPGFYTVYIRNRAGFEVCKTVKVEF